MDVVVNDHHYCCATLTGTLISANIGAPAVSREDALKSTRKIFLDNILKGAPWLRLRLYSTTRSIKIMTQNNDNGSTFLYHLGWFFFYKKKTNVSFSFLSSIPSLTLFWSGGLLIHGDEQLTATRAGVRQSIHICALPNTTPDDDGGGLLLLVMLMAMMTNCHWQYCWRWF